MATIHVYSPFNDVSPEGNSRVSIQYLTGASVTVGVERAGIDTADGLVTYEGGHSAWSELDRKGCNNLIRAIREARDRAYGRDE